MEFVPDRSEAPAESRVSERRDASGCDADESEGLRTRSCQSCQWSEWGGGGALLDMPGGALQCPDASMCDLRKPGHKQ